MPQFQSYFADSLSTAEHSGGVTGSVRVSVLEYGKKVYFQFKSTILKQNKTDLRRVKAQSHDHENLRDVWMAQAFKPMLGSLCPEVISVYDPDRKQFNVASKYLSNVHKGTLDEYYASLDEQFAQEFKELNNPNHRRKKLSNGAKHCKVALGEGRSAPGEFTLYVKEDSAFAKSLAEALAMSAIGADHDVNPGNMIVVQDPETKEIKVARIDFGHALGDLLDAPRLFGGRLNDKENPVFDFFNRRKVAGAKKGGDISKLWRDYSGFVPSKVLADALISLGGNTEKLEEGLRQARQEILDLYSMIIENPDDNKTEEHLLNSLRHIYKNVTGRRVAIIKGFEHQALMQMLGGIENAVRINAQNAVKAGKMMRLQAELNQDVPNLKQEGFDKFCNKWVAKFKAEGLVGKGDKVIYPWFKESKDSNPQQVGIREYIINKFIVEAAKDVANEPSKANLLQIRRVLDDIRKYLVSMFKKRLHTKSTEKQFKSINNLQGDVELSLYKLESFKRSKNKFGAFETSVHSRGLFAKGGMVRLGASADLSPEESSKNNLQ